MIHFIRDGHVINDDVTVSLRFLLNHFALDQLEHDMLHEHSQGDAADGADLITARWLVVVRITIVIELIDLQ